MPVDMDNVWYDLLPHPDYEGYQPVRISPKVRFQAEAGYVQQRNRYPSDTKKITCEWKIMSEAEYNLLMAWIEEKGSDAFWFVLPESLSTRPDGTTIPKGIWCRIIDEEIPETPKFHNDGFWRNVKVTLESIGPAVEGTAPTA